MKALVNRYASDLVPEPMPALHILVLDALRGNDRLQEAEIRYSNAKNRQELLSRWVQPSWIQAAALFIGLDESERQLFKDCTELLGTQATKLLRLVYGLAPSHYDTGPSAEHRFAVDLPVASNATDSQALLILNAAAVSFPCSGPYVPFTPLAELAKTICELSNAWPFPLALAGLIETPLNAADEQRALSLYREGLQQIRQRSKAAAVALAECAEACSWVFEPFVYGACCALIDGDESLASKSLIHAKGLIDSSGLVWDHRLQFDEWRWLINAISRHLPRSRKLLRGGTGATEPIALLHLFT